ncbi:MAG: hypothetical protein IKW99_02270 [Bacteroidales bacterium]|nr:hypothetical protein [Bacteroidales bacterium]
MTDYEKQVIVEAIKRNAPKWYEQLRQKQQKKHDMISVCIDIASRRDNDCYQDEVNRIYNTCCSLMNQTETYLLNYICLIKHREQLNDGILKDDADIQRWIGYLQDLRNTEDSVIGILTRQAQHIINQYRIKNAVGRPKGSGKRIFSYNDKEYRTIQECADDYCISKQAMHKRLKKLHII